MMATWAASYPRWQAIKIYKELCIHDDFSRVPVIGTRKEKLHSGLENRKIRNDLRGFTNLFTFSKGTFRLPPTYHQGISPDASLMDWGSCLSSTRNIQSSVGGKGVLETPR